MVRSGIHLVAVPAELQQPSGYAYPAHQRGPDIEAFAIRWFAEHRPDLPFVPVAWTQTYLRRRAFRPQPDAQMVLDSLDPTWRYFTVCLNDDGILESVPSNVTVFSAGGAGDAAIPMLCDPHPIRDCSRDLFCTFVGALTAPANNRTGVRPAMAAAMDGKPGVHLIDRTADVEAFELVMARSMFALCPRGYGRTSYRLYEAMQMGAVPVYVYDDPGPWLPWADVMDWSQLAVLCHVAELPGLYDRLAGMTAAAWCGMRAAIRAAWLDHFTMDGMCRQIVRMMDTHLERDGPARTRRPD